MTVLVYMACVTCGGSRRLYYSTARGLCWDPCSGCGGVGSTMRVVGA